MRYKTCVLIKSQIAVTNAIVVWARTKTVQQNSWLVIESSSAVSVRQSIFLCSNLEYAEHLSRATQRVLLVLLRPLHGSLPFCDVLVWNHNLFCSSRLPRLSSILHWLNPNDTSFGFGTALYLACSAWVCARSRPQLKDWCESTASQLGCSVCFGVNCRAYCPRDTYLKLHISWLLWRYLHFYIQSSGSFEYFDSCHRSIFTLSIRIARNLEFWEMFGSRRVELFPSKTESLVIQNVQCPLCWHMLPVRKPCEWAFRDSQRVLASSRLTLVTHSALFAYFLSTAGSWHRFPLLLPIFSA